MRQNLLAALVAGCTRHARLVALAGLLLAALGALSAWQLLGVSTDTDAMFAASLPWRQRAIAMDRDFPQAKDLIVLVVDADIPEEADATAAALNAALQADHAHFHASYRPDASPYLSKEGLLFLDQKTLQALLDGTIDAQPFLGQLVADPSARGLFASLGLLGLGVQHGQADLGPFTPALDGFHAAMRGAIDGRARPLSWTELLSGSLAQLGGKYRFVLAQPVLDFGALQPGGAATAAARAAAADLEFVRSGAARVRITGPVALADEEFATVAHGAVYGLAGSLALIALWLFLAVRTWRLVLPILGTLILGLLSTLLFASLAVGTLNVVSVGFGILFVGIAVDFSIQFSVRYREVRHLALGHAPAMDLILAETGRRAGVQILVAAAATAAGFLAFVPTDFSGVAELGLIAGVGMLIAFACTVTFLPAAITLARPRDEPAEVGFAFAAPLDARMRRVRKPLLVVFALLAALGVALAPSVTFDSDPLHTKDPNTEAMRTLRDLMESPLTNPYSIDILTADVASADALAERLRALPLVDEALTLDSLVPTDQAPKLAAIADANSVLAATLAPRGAPPPVTPDDIRLAAKTALGQIEPALAKLPASHPVRDIADDLRRLAQAPDATLLAVNEALTRFLPAQLDQLRLALSAAPATRASVPPELSRDWVLADGRARVQATPRAEARDAAGLHAFVRQVQSVAPDAGGSAVTIVATADTIVGAFKAAAVGALLAIAAILFVALRRPLDVALVLAPLLLSALMTLIVVVLAPLPINFANIIALPLLLGVGVSFNIYFVMNWRAGRRDVLGSATARAVMFSALTTGSAFGTLALSYHPGTASMGELLLVSLGCTLIATLVFIPALLSVLPQPRQVDGAKDAAGVVG
jgi:hopanoid biosynthesis associated RND transporter like protein HpnN